MGGDEEYLERLRRYEDPAEGISEEFLPVSLGPRAAHAILSRPLGESRAVGWVVCAALAKERSFVRRLEAVVARSLASNGFPALRLRGGSDDADGTAREISFGARLAEAEDAVELLRSETGTTAIGTVGALAGGTAAALVADRLELPMLALLEPVVRGKQYLRDLLRMQALSALVKPEAEGTAPTQRSLDELRTRGWTTIRGFRLTQEVYDEIAAADLVEDVKRFRGASLIVNVSRSGQPSAPLLKLRDRLEELGGRAELRTVQDPLVVAFGENYLRDVSYVRRDTRIELDRKLADVFVGWLAEEPAAGGGR
ncbi:MAG TPA: hypothetical protein VH816_12505 [Gaiellaceae bacterium]|jgi:hypothetical protein